ncbi:MULTISPECIES: hypothetical protein [unclassified Chelatococcus]|uniref:hypothetical protein n=1 Tax=unclassified Chelatococcus TaxID=2638111 RepID=UPI001BCBC6A6|nr:MULTISPECIES: hypothetical protein [unclassified Chelatococcus]MBS7698686.1 hypothetical protein [Chelatococcus sp. YT9]MBX3554732.1 hypothetical protein [Chelatococcus sp.]
MSQDDRDRLIVAYAEALAEREANSGKAVPTIRKGRGQPKGTATETAKALGVSKRRVNQAIARARGVKDERKPDAPAQERPAPARKPQADGDDRAASLHASQAEILATLTAAWDLATVSTRARFQEYAKSAPLIVDEADG